MWGPFCYIFLLMGEPFSPCEGGLFAPFSPYGGGGGAFIYPMGGLLWEGVHAHYIYYNTVMLKCIDIQIYKITVIIPTHTCIYAPIAVNMC